MSERLRENKMNRQLIKISGIIIIAILIIFCCACSKNNKDNAGKTKPQTQMTDLYFFRTSNGRNLKFGGFAGVPIKINPSTKSVSLVCVDPLCGDDYYKCPLYGCENLYAVGNYLFYTTGYISVDSETSERFGSVKFCVYDMINGSSRQLAEYYDSFMFAGGTQDYLYYYIAKYRETESVSRVDYILYRAEAKNGKIIEMPMHSEYSTESGYIDANDYPTIYTVDNNKIYWYAIEPKNKTIFFYTTDLDGKNKKNLNFGGNPRVMNGIYNNGYAYYTVDDFIYEEHIKFANNYERWRVLFDLKLYKIPINGGKTQLIAEHIINFAPLGDKIYYTLIEDNPELIEYNGEKNWNWSGGKLYVMNSNGTDKRLLCETGYNLDGFMNLTEAKTINGVDYIIFAFWDIVENSYYTSGYEYNYSQNTLLINCETGECTELSAINNIIT